MAESLFKTTWRKIVAAVAIALALFHLVTAW